MNLVSKANCICKYSQLLTQPLKTCFNTKCLNGGTCISTSDKGLCKCPQGFEGPYCEQRTRSFIDSPSTSTSVVLSHQSFPKIVEYLVLKPKNFLTQLILSD